MKKIRVIIFLRQGRKHYEAQWTDPVSKLKKTRSTGEAKKRDAYRFAGALEKELNDGTFKQANNVTWAEFRHRYETDVLSGKAEKTPHKAFATFAAVERHINPKMLAALDEGQISKLQRELRKANLAEATIKGHMAHLKCALRWAFKKKLIREVPHIDMPTPTAGMMGRPITTEELERMLAKTEEATDADIADSWKHLLRGLWWSGLRLGEALALDWEDASGICVDFAGRRPMFIIQPKAQKSHKAQILPMAAEFAKFLEAVPDDDRVGRVFDPRPQRGTGRMRLDSVSKVISRIGKLANVRVAENEKGRIKYASAHDLRRAFGVRWSQRVMPPILQQMMRHESIETTMRFYVGRDAQVAADAIRDAFDRITNTSANNQQKQATGQDDRSPESVSQQGLNE